MACVFKISNRISLFFGGGEAKLPIMSPKCSQHCDFKHIDNSKFPIELDSIQQEI